MKTKYDIGQSVFIKGTIRRIAIDGKGVIYYDVDFDGDLDSYGNIHITEKEIDEIQKERKEK